MARKTTNTTFNINIPSIPLEKGESIIFKFQMEGNSTGSFTASLGTGALKVSSLAASLGYASTPYPYFSSASIATGSNSNEIISLQNQKYLLCHNWFNYYHFLTETVYKIFATGIKNSDFVFIFPEGIFESSFVEEIINMLEINYIKIPNKQSSIFHFEKLFFVSEKPHCEEFNSEVVRKMKSFFRTKITIKKNDRKIYVSRKAKQRRSFKNHDDVENVFLEFGFEIIYAEDLTFTQQLKLFSEACFIAGLHGAGLTNMIFANEGCQILEIMPMKKKD